MDLPERVVVVVELIVRKSKLSHYVFAHHFHLVIRKDL